MVMTRRTWALACALVAAAGCAGDAEPRPDPDPEIELDPGPAGALGIDAARGSVRVRLELRRGASRPAAWQGDLRHDGQYEGDVMVLDAQGRPVLVELGGHAAVDAAWQERIERVQGPIDPKLRRRELELAGEAATQLAAAGRLDHESQLLIAGLASSIRATLDGFDDGPEVVASAEPSPADGSDAGTGSALGRVGRLGQALGAGYVHQVYVRGAACCWPGYQHSSTRLRIFDAYGVLVSDLKTRNHGRWVDDPSMRTAVGCPRAYRGRANQTPLYVPYLATDSFGDGRAGGCQTAYGVLSGEHVCNDDSFAQYSNVRDNPFLVPSYATCSDTTLRGTTPTCF
jgi:hypothetical protein